MAVFSVASRVSFENIARKWIPEINCHAPGVPFFLIGLEIDQRSAGGDFVSKEEGTDLAKKLRAEGYLECSARTQEGLKFAFDSAVRCVLKRRFPEKLSSSFFGIIVIL